MKNAAARGTSRAAQVSEGDYTEDARAGAIPAISEASRPAQSPDPFEQKLTAFRERCSARALLTAEGYGSLQDAVDQLWASAGHQGLIRRYGADAIQAIMSDAFAKEGRQWTR